MWWKTFCPCYETFQTSLKLLRNKRQEGKEGTMSPDNEVPPLCFICKQHGLKSLDPISLELYVNVVPGILPNE